MPRHSRPILTYNQVSPARRKLASSGRFEKIFRDPHLSKTFKKWSGHGLVPMLLGAAVTVQGHSAMEIRSVAMLICALWLALSIGVEICEWKILSQMKVIIFCAAASLSCCFAMITMHWFLNSTLTSQRRQTFESLAASPHIIPGRGDDPMTTMFTVINDGRFAISRRHQISCYVSLAVGNGGTSEDAGVMSTVVGDHIVFGNVENFPFAAGGAPLLPGGDAQTDPCLRYLGFATGTNCVDMTLIFRYYLANQDVAEYEQIKRFRFVAYRGTDGRFGWYPEPVEQQENYCANFYRGPHPQMSR